MVRGAYDDLVFSPDGKYLYYSDRADAATNHRSLYRRPVEGGPVEKIVNDFPHGSGKITFSPCDEKFAFIRQDEKVGLGTLVIANLDGTQEESIITRKEPDYFPTQSRGASWSPDGKHIVYVGVNAADGSARIFEVDLESLTEKPLTSLKWNDLIGDLTWLPDSSGILFIAGNTSISNAIWRVTYPAGQLEQITNDLNNYYLLSVAGDSNTLVTIKRTRDVDLWIAPDSDANRARRIMPSRQNGFYGVAWAPDSKIVYTSETSGNSDIWIANADGTNQRQLTADVHQDVWPAVTNDGRYIVFISNRAGADHVWRMDIDGKNQIQLTDGVKTGHPDCSPDSKWVVYPASVSGKTTIWKVSIEGGAPYEISDLACDNPAVSHDGRMIACMSDTHQRLILPFDGGHAIATIELRVRPGFVSGIPRWMPDDRALMYADFSDGVMNFWIKPIEGGQEKQLTYFRPDQVAASHGVLGYAWSPEGKDLLYARYERKSDMVMISGFK
jgi:Tol biopolymer transport system component